MPDTPKIITPEWKHAGNQASLYEQTGRQLRADGHADLASRYREQATELREAVEHLTTVGGIMRDSVGSDRSTATVQASAVKLIGWLIAYGWTPPADLAPLLIDDPEVDTDEKGETDA
ncbi:hypothetical protein GTE6_64 [Gordonia phage GTE6]|uniref:Uncharacterized protein n=1 Tax=Gordonia phage GTE6 TaxID=1647474 RepID=A0A0K0MWH4_9CAUD|nr:hypothetical protein AU100_gp64 [Gordonia phage GTE6]AKI28706.1 hypothetical protein GTE6_64 [Gordonia phage GTE6]